MSSFTSAAWEPTTLPASDGNAIFAIRGAEGKGFVFWIGFEGSTLFIHVPEGFLTDGPSIPSIVRWLVPKSAIKAAMKAAAVHDKLCEDPRFDRPTADAVFLMAMYAEKTPAVWREVFFNAVRTNGSKARRNPDDVVLAA